MTTTPPTPDPFFAGLEPGIRLHLRVRGLRPSATVAINERSNALRHQGRRIYKLGLGQSPFPVPEVVAQRLRDNAHQKDYLPVKGLLELRREVARRYGARFSTEVDAADVLVGPGSKELMFLLQLVYDGELVLPTPSWVSYAPQARILGRPVRLLPTRGADGWRLTADQLEALCRSDPGCPRIVILNDPSNPTAASYSAAALDELAEVAQRYRVILLSDEIYSRLRFDGERHSMVSRYPRGTILSTGLSKWCGAGGWRLGVFVFPPGLRWLCDAMTAVASETYTSTSAPIQYAAVRAYQGGPEIDAYLDASRRVLSALGCRLATDLHRAGAEVHTPQGGFYLFPDFSPLAERLATRGIRTSAELCERLLEETGVAILPGSDFGRPAEELTVRLAYVDFDGAKALAGASETPGAELDDAFLRRHCGDCLEAVERLCAWLADSPGTTR